MTDNRQQVYTNNCCLSAFVCVPITDDSLLSVIVGHLRFTLSLPLPLVGWVSRVICLGALARPPWSTGRLGEHRYATVRGTTRLGLD